MKNPLTEADVFAEALLQIKLDPVGELLCFAAEMAAKYDEPHPIKALANVAPSKEMYREACGRVFDAAGLDQLDLSMEECIDTLVAAAYWEVP